jgi:hypothetical protein
VFKNCSELREFTLPDTPSSGDIDLDWRAFFNNDFPWTPPLTIVTSSDNAASNYAKYWISAMNDNGVGFKDIVFIKSNDIKGVRIVSGDEDYNAIISDDVYIITMPIGTFGINYTDIKKLPITVDFPQNKQESVDPEFKKDKTINYTINSKPLKIMVQEELVSNTPKYISVNYNGMSFMAERKSDTLYEIRLPDDANLTNLDLSIALPQGACVDGFGFEGHWRLKDTIFKKNVNLSRPYDIKIGTSNNGDIKTITISAALTDSALNSVRYVFVKFDTDELYIAGQNGRTYTVTLPRSTDISTPALPLYINLHPEAAIQDDDWKVVSTGDKLMKYGGYHNFNNKSPLSVMIENEDSIRIIVDNTEDSHETKPKSVRVDFGSVIYSAGLQNDGKTYFINLPSGTAPRLPELPLVVELPRSADILPSIDKTSDFSDGRPKQYVITAQDGRTKADISIDVKVSSINPRPGNLFKLTSEDCVIVYTISADRTVDARLQLPFARSADSAGSNIGSLAAEISSVSADVKLPRNISYRHAGGMNYLQIAFRVEKESDLYSEGLQLDNVTYWLRGETVEFRQDFLPPLLFKDIDKRNETPAGEGGGSTGGGGGGGGGCSAGLPGLAEIAALTCILLRLTRHRR